MKMAIETRPFDAAEYITDAEGAEEFLRAAFESEHPGVIGNALGVVARSRGMTALAEDTGITRQALYKALSEKGNAEFATVLKVAHALGFRLMPERLPT
jgi:probable addiction module antidote protein